MVCGNLEGWDRVGGEGAVQRKGAYVYLWPIHVDVWQKPTQYCKAVILQFTINKIFKRLLHYRKVI